MKGEVGNSKTNGYLDILKLISAIGIITIHVPLTRTLGVATDCLARTGVVLFFVIAGYYSYYLKSQKIWYKIGTLLIQFVSLQIAYMLLYRALEGISIHGNFSIKAFLYAIFFNVSLSGDHLWFMSALIYCYLALLIFNRFKVFRYVYLMIPVVWAVFLLLRHLVPYTNQNVALTRNFWFVGFPFFFLGHYIRDKEEDFANKDWVVLLFLVGIGACMILLERKFTIPMSYYLGTIPMAIGLFVMCIKAEDAKVPSLLLPISVVGGRCSAFIYYWHLAVHMLLLQIGSLEMPISSRQEAVLVILFTTAIAIGIKMGRN